MRVRTALRAFSFVVLPLAVFVACGSSKPRSGFENDDDAGPIGFGGDSGLGEGGAITGIGRDPVTCEEAAQYKTYVGCDYWPTVTDNAVANVFDFAVAVANGGADPASVTVTGPNGVNKKVTVDGGSIGTVYLPWVDALKGNNTTISSSVLAAGGAYHLVSDKPVVVYQFNPLEFKAAGGEPGKDWSQCIKPPGVTAPDCYSYTNDASLLLPSTAMTGTYRLMGPPGWSVHRDPLTGAVDPSGPLTAQLPAYFAVTGTADGTKVTVKLTGRGTVVGGGAISSSAGGATISFTLDAGDVAEVVGPPGQDNDFSGSLLTADKPVQVITGISCTYFPLDTQACDHVEETVFPAETLGKHYVVMRPSGPKSNNVGHVVRFFGNVDGTELTYKPSQPAGCPAFLNAGQVADCGMVTSDFEVSAEHEFGVATFQIGGAMADPDFDPTANMQPQGDPSQSFAVTVEQYRKSYVFLAPTDYKTSFVDIIGSAGVSVTLDGADISSKLKAISGTSFLGGHVQLGDGKDGVHVLEASDPIGIQVIGYGDNTSYQYPGGLNLSAISAAPVK